MSPSIASFREWARLMAIVAGGCQDDWLRQISRVLLELVNTLKAALPSWTACLSEEGSLLESVALKMFSKGKLDILVKSHNDVHEFLGKSNRCAKIESRCCPKPWWH